jgi:hypothetical protein
MIKLSRRQATSVPHPELLPLTEQECTWDDWARDRDPMLSQRDYSQEQVNRAIQRGKVPGDMREYCHNNGISWQHVTRRR